MDFQLSQDQESVAGLARKIFESEVTETSLRQLEANGDRFHRGVWDALSQAELLGIAIPTSYGGAGMGFLELCLILQEQGRTVAPVPLLPTLVMGALPMAEFGRPEQQERYLRPQSSGKFVSTACLFDAHASSPADIATQAAPDGSSWRLSGVKVSVPGADKAEVALVPAQIVGGSVAVFVVPLNRDGVSVTLQTTTSGEQVAEISFDGVRVGTEEVLGSLEKGDAIVRWTLERTLVGMCAMQLGIAERQLELLAEYASKRKQFGQPIGAFQAVSQRAADTYIDVEGMRVTLWQAAWRLSQGLDATRETMIARYWACEGGHRVAAAAQHIHGGIGVDCDYPLHRYTLLAKQLELMTGGANQILGWLGAYVASEEIGT